MQKPSLIPIFPLDVVLLPAMVLLPLHIFEPRYRIMIGRCLAERIEFGMVFASNQATATVGCTAEITRKLKDYPDGRMDILTEGRSVFCLKELHEQKEYYEGTVEYLVDEPSIPDVQQRARLAEVFEKCHMLMFGRPWEEAESTDANLLAYRMAAHLPMELHQRQVLLEMRKENERRDFLIGWLDEFLPKLAGQERTRKRAAGNGNALN